MFSAGVPILAISPATPQSSRISIARLLSTCALGRSEVSGRALTSRCSWPSRASSIEAVRPAPPPPTIRTGVSSRLIPLLPSLASTVPENE